MNSNSNTTVANQVLALIVSNQTQFELLKNRFYVSWVTPQSVLIKKAWQISSKSDFLPAFYKDWAQDEARCIALSHLAKWLQGRNVLPLSSWVEWIATGFWG